MLSIENLGKRFGGKPALAGVTAGIADGSFVGVIGRSGAGKSTLLRCINRLVDPSEGRIAFHGKDVTGLRGKALRDWRSSCGMIFQQFNLTGRLDVLTNVLMGRINHMSLVPALLKAWPDDEKLRALRALDRLDLADLADQRAESLSGGQQQRVAIARTLVQDPRIILADEPVASLDPRNTKIVMDSLRDLHREAGITVMCNLHSLELAREYCTRLIGMKAGRVVFDGTPEMLTDDIVIDLYGLEANDVLDLEEAAARQLNGSAALPSAA
ncbi:MAG: phosphonate ABC transporter ATP-binding protein [Aestuariivirga sp.]|uniref:phosphonate ABC transporter ATP-binding protein n=1 Tax=Aestuariivirga sp. TaxID=2650926 RepID=UPI0025BFA025|nr:phosphonate ABC transporter ATP-binding protein [Aestuariivirga sp.]MCA3560321.1 phosphonate ABC transporter ATP-binding protein [Aestuariivirga sp.]